MTKNTTLPLRLPRSLKTELEQLARADGVSMNQFITVAIAEKLSALRTESYFAERRSRADLNRFDVMLNREGGQPPQAGDELPE
ncbi:MAG: toxin-antitoxin system HicB family antitoxin [Chloroflexota bacterium]